MGKNFFMGLIKGAKRKIQEKFGTILPVVCEDKIDGILYQFADIDYIGGDRNEILSDIIKRSNNFDWKGDNCSADHIIKIWNEELSKSKKSKKINHKILKSKIIERAKNYVKIFMSKKFYEAKDSQNLEIYAVCAYLAKAKMIFSNNQSLMLFNEKDFNGAQFSNNMKKTIFSGFLSSYSSKTKMNPKKNVTILFLAMLKNYDLIGRRHLINILNNYILLLSTNQLENKTHILPDVLEDISEIFSKEFAVLKKHIRKQRDNKSGQFKNEEFDEKFIKNLTDKSPWSGEETTSICDGLKKAVLTIKDELDRNEIKVLNEIKSDEINRKKEIFDKIFQINKDIVINGLDSIKKLGESVELNKTKEYYSRTVPEKFKNIFSKYKNEIEKINNKKDKSQEEIIKTLNAFFNDVISHHCEDFPNKKRKVNEGKADNPKEADDLDIDDTLTKLKDQTIKYNEKLTELKKNEFKNYNVNTFYDYVLHEILDKIFYSEFITELSKTLKKESNLFNDFTFYTSNLDKKGADSLFYFVRNKNFSWTKENSEAVNKINFNEIENEIVTKNKQSANKFHQVSIGLNLLHGKNKKIFYSFTKSKIMKKIKNFELKNCKDFGVAIYFDIEKDSATKLMREIINTQEAEKE
ncbi:MAG: hypothetical protein FWC41_03865 [Firmicutes bacterium]|nr:hypothetical protein [Bacillota bacterium]